MAGVEERLVLFHQGKAVHGPKRLVLKNEDQGKLGSLCVGFCGLPQFLVHSAPLPTLNLVYMC